MRLRTKILLTCLAVALLTAGAWMFLRHRARMAPAEAALNFSRVLESADASRIRELTKIPVSLAEKSPSEQDSLLLELLTSEISAAGVRHLTADGQFGPLKEIFPDEADAWAKSFLVSPDDCVAFRMEREGIRAELVLLKSGDSYKILRCNNVRQMAGDLTPQ